MLHRNVRGIGIALCLLTLFLFLSGCGSLKDDTLLTVNAVITEVDTGKQTITVKDDADENTLGEECLIDCSSTPMVYCDFATQKVTKISFEDLQVNDKVIMCIRSSEMESFRSGGGENTIKVEQLQLYTQRAAGYVWHTSMLSGSRRAAIIAQSLSESFSQKVGLTARNSYVPLSYSRCSSLECRTHCSTAENFANM